MKIVVQKEFAKSRAIRAIRAMRASVFYVPTCQKRVVPLSHFYVPKCQRANKRANVPKAC